MHFWQLSGLVINLAPGYLVEAEVLTVCRPLNSRRSNGISQVSNLKPNISRPIPGINRFAVWSLGHD
jgi:hypothetical protein